MKTRQKFGSATVVLVSLLALSGCWVQSVYPFYEDSDVIVDSNLTGTWAGDGELKGCSLGISLDATVQAYTLVVSKSADADPNLECDSMTSQGKLVQMGHNASSTLHPTRKDACRPPWILF
jgi:hypothetical protein